MKRVEIAEKVEEAWASCGGVTDESLMDVNTIEGEGCESSYLSTR